MADNEENLNTLQYFISTNQFAQIQHIYIRLPNGNVEQMDPQIKYIFNAVAANGTTIDVLDADTTYIARTDTSISDLKHNKTLKFRGINEDQYGYPTQYTVDVYDLTYRFELGDNISITPIPVGEDEANPEYYKLLISATDTTYTVDDITLQLDTRNNNKLSIKSLLTKLAEGSGILLSTAGTSPFKTTITAPGNSLSVLLDKGTNLRGLITAWMYKVNPLWLSGQGASNYNVSGGLSTIIEGTIGSAISGTKSLKIKQNKTTGTPAYITSYNLDVNPEWLSGSTDNKEGYTAITNALNKYINGYYNSSNASINTLKFDGTKVILALDNGDINTHLEANLCLTKNYTTLTDENPKTVTIDLKETDGTTTWDRNGVLLSGSRGVTVTTTTSSDKDILVISGTLYYGDTDQNAGFISSIVKNENNTFTVYDIHTRLKGANQIEIITPTASESGVTTISIAPGEYNQVLKTLKDDEDNLYVGWELVAGDKSYYDGRLIAVSQDTYQISSTLSGDEYATTILSDDEFATGKIKIVPAPANINDFGNGYILSTSIIGTGASRKLSAMWQANPGYITSYKNATYSCNDTSLIFPTTQNENGDNNVVVNHLWLSTANPSAVITSVVTSYLNSLTHNSTNDTLKIDPTNNTISWGEDKSGTGGDGDHGFKYTCSNGSITFPNSVATSNFKTSSFSDNIIYVNPNWLSGSTDNKEGYNAVVAAVTKYISGIYKTNVDASEDNATKTTLKYDTTNKKIILENDLGVNIWYRYGNTATTADKRNTSLIFEPEGGGANSTLTGDTAISVNPTWIDERISSFLTGLTGHDNDDYVLKIDDGSLSWQEDERGALGTSYYGDERTIHGYQDAGDNDKNKFTIKAGGQGQILSTTNSYGTLSAVWATPSFKDTNTKYSNYDDSLIFYSPNDEDIQLVKVSEEWLTSTVNDFLLSSNGYDNDLNTTLKRTYDEETEKWSLIWGAPEGGADGNNTYSAGDKSLLFNQPNPAVLGLYDNVTIKVNPAWLTGFYNDNNSNAASSHKPSGGYTAIVNGLLSTRLSSDSIHVNPHYFEGNAARPVTGYTLDVNPAWLSGTNTAGTDLSGGSKAISSFLKSTNLGSSLITGLASAFLTGLAHTNLTNPVLKINSSHQISWGEDITGGNDGNTRYTLSSVANVTTNGSAAIQLLSSSNGTNFANQKSFKLSGDGTYVKVTTDDSGNFIINGSHSHTYTANTNLYVNKGATNANGKKNLATTNADTYIRLVLNDTCRGTAIQLSGQYPITLSAPDPDGKIIVSLTPPTNPTAGIAYFLKYQDGKFEWVEAGGCEDT